MLFDSFITAQLGYWDNCCYACLEFNFSKIFLSSGAAKFYARLKLMYPVIFRRACLPQLASMKKLWRWRGRPPNLARYTRHYYWHLQAIYGYLVGDRSFHCFVRIPNALHGINIDI